MGTVNVQVAIHDLTTRKAAVIANMGWVHTARTLAVSWPHGSRLKVGTYHVSVSAHDHHSGNLKRTAHSSGRGDTNRPGTCQSAAATGRARSPASGCADTGADGGRRGGLPRGRAP